MTTYTENCTRSRVENSVGVLDILIGRIGYYAKIQLLKARIRQERRQLSEMSGTMLKDLGISRFDAEQEAQRTDVPAARLKAL